MTAPSRIWPIALIAVFLAGCGSGSTAGPPSEEPPVSAAPAGGLPPGCHPADLRSPSGERVDLTGDWAGSGILAGHDETAWLNQIGDCVFGSVIGGEISRGPGRTIANLSGRIADLGITFDVVLVAQGDQFLFGEYSTMEMLIEWDDEGRLQLREDRQPGESAGRCIECPAPLIWYRVDDPSS